MDHQQVKSKCTINRRLLPVKVSYFTLFAGMACTWNFITLHMKSLGLSASEIGIINGVPPFLGAFSTVLGGAIADRFRIHSQLAGSLVILTTFIQGSLFFIPMVLHKTTYFNQTELVTANASQSLQNATTASFLNSCNHNMDLVIHHGNTSHCYLYYCDTTYNFTLNCDTSRKSGQSTTSNATTSEPCNTVTWNCTNPTQELSNTTSCNSYKLLPHSNSPEEKCNFLNSTIFLISSLCDQNSLKLQCTLLTNNYGNQNQRHKNFGLIFRVYFAIFGSAVILMNPIWPLLNAIAYALLGKERNSWGRQRLWGTLGDGLIVFPLSVAMHYYGKGKEPNFIPNFCGYFIITIISGVIIFRLKGKVKVGPSPSMWRDLKCILKIWETYMLLILGLVFGSFLGVIFTTQPLFITAFDGGNEMLVALGIVANIVGETPMLFLARHVMDRLGYVRCLYLACLAFALRFFLYMIITSPWYILPINLLHGFTYGIMYSALTAYMSSLTPPALHGTTQSLISTLTWNMGYGIGTALSGEMMDRLGARKTYAVFSGCSLATLVIYFAYINILVRICTWNQDKKGSKEFKLVTPTTAADSIESVQLLLSSDGSDTEH